MSTVCDWRRLADTAPMASLPAAQPAAFVARDPGRDEGQSGEGHEARADASVRASGGGLSRLSAELEAAPGRPDISYPGRRGGHLRARLLLASLPALPPEPAQVEPGVLGAQVRAQPGARRTQAAPARSGRLAGLRDLGVRHPRPARRRGRGDLDDAGEATASPPSLAPRPARPPAPSAAAHRHRPRAPAARRW